MSDTLVPVCHLPQGDGSGFRKMIAETRAMEYGRHLPEDQASLLKQIADAGKQKKIRYLISVPGLLRKRFPYERQPFATSGHAGGERFAMDEGPLRVGGDGP